MTILYEAVEARGLRIVSSRPMITKLVMAALVGGTVTGCSGLGSFTTPDYDVTANSTSEVPKASSEIDEGYTQSYVTVETEARGNDDLRSIVDELQSEYESADVLSVDFYEVDAQTDDFRFKNATAHNTELGKRAAYVDFGDTDTVIQETDPSPDGAEGEGYAPPETTFAPPEPPTVALGESVELDSGSTLTIEGVEELTTEDYEALVEEAAPNATVSSTGPYVLVEATFTNGSDEYSFAPSLEVRTDQTTSSSITAYGGPEDEEELDVREVAPGASYEGLAVFSDIPGEVVEIAVGDLYDTPQAIVEVE